VASAVQQSLIGHNAHMSRRPTPNSSAPPIDATALADGNLGHRRVGLPAIGVTGLAVIAGSYLVGLADAVAGSPLIGATYVTIVLCSFASMNLIVHGARAGWTLALAISVAAVAGYLADHHDASPGLADKATTFIGGRLAATSLTAEGVVIAVSVCALFRLRRR
jgi:hypothetical protein